MERREILKTLLDQLAEATETHRLHQQYFQVVVNDIPSGLPHPDGVQRIANASTECAHARARMRTARLRLQLYKDYGFVPNDLK
jgi:hypothetical protein